MKLSQLVRAKIVIGELLAVMAWDHRNEPDHWSHTYTPLATAMIYVSATSFPNDSINSHMAHVFLENEETKCES